MKTLSAMLGLLLFAGAAYSQNSGMTNFAVSDGNHVFYIASNSHVNQLWLRPNAAPVNQDITALTGGPLVDSRSALVSCALADGDHIFYVDVNQHVNQFFYSETTYTFGNTDLTAAGSAPLAAPHSALALLALSDGDHVFYIDVNQHVDQLWNTGSSWVSQGLGQTAAVGSALATCSQADGDHIFYIDGNRQVNQLWYNTGTNAWISQDLTVAGSGPAAVSGSALAVMSLSDGDHIFYLSANQHVNQLWYNNGSNRWIVQDVTVGSSAPVAIAGSPLTTCGLADGDHIFFISANQHVNQLWYNPANTTWSDQDVTASGRGSNSEAGTALTVLALSDGDHVFYADSNLQVNQLWFNASTFAWTNQDLTASASGPLVMAFGNVSPGGPLNLLPPAKDYVYLNGQVVAIETPH